MGGYSNVDPPLSIPNREVKHISADGTGFSGRVSLRPFFFLYIRFLFVLPTTFCTEYAFTSIIIETF